MKKYLATLVCLIALAPAVLAGCSSKTGGQPGSTTQVSLSPLGLTVKQVLTDYWGAFDKFDEPACLSYVAPDYVDTWKPTLEDNLDSFSAGKAFNVKLVPNLFSEPVKMADGRLDVRVTVGIVPGGLSKDQYLMYYMENVGGTWMIDLQTSDISKTAPGRGPTNLECKIISVHEVDMTWKDNSTLDTGYKVERSTDPKFIKDVKIFTLPANSEAYDDKTTSAGALYYYKVVCFNPAGDSPSSSVVTLQMPAK